jgi:hypothetical protein
VSTGARRGPVARCGIRTIVAMPFTPDGFACNHCGAPLSIDSCFNCGRLFVYTVASLENRRREFDDEPLLPPHDIEASGLCDYCAAKERGEPPVDLVNAGLRQKTCPFCHTDTLS